MMVFDGFDVSVVSLRRWRHCIIALCTHLLLVSFILASGSHVSHPSTVSHHRDSTSETCFPVLCLADAAPVFCHAVLHSRPAALSTSSTQYRRRNIVRERRTDDHQPRSKCHDLLSVLRSHLLVFLARLKAMSNLEYEKSLCSRTDQ